MSEQRVKKKSCSEKKKERKKSLAKRKKATPSLSRAPPSLPLPPLTLSMTEKKTRRGPERPPEEEELNSCLQGRWNWGRDRGPDKNIRNRFFEEKKTLIFGFSFIFFVSACAGCAVAPRGPKGGGGRNWGLRWLSSWLFWFF